MDADLPVVGREQRTPTPEQEHEIAALVDRFYEVARRDPVLGPIFDGQVTDWDAHLATMRAFWCSALYRTGRYAGRPLDAHRRVPTIRAEHFPRWIHLWRQAVDETVASDAGTPLKEMASRMATAMSTRLRLPL